MSNGPCGEKWASPRNDNPIIQVEGGQEHNKARLSN
jgi:hypothetical protein